jgi:chemotaxis protein MotA
MAARPHKGRRIDAGAVLGLVIGFAGIGLGYLLEGGKPLEVAGRSAACIVIGGCVGATVMANPLANVRSAMRRLSDIFFVVQSEARPAELIETIVGLASKARKSGLVSLESDAEQIPDPFLKKSLMLAVDGADLKELRSTMELQIDVEETRAESDAKVYESAGGFAPTIGIIGAVLGLIIVMNEISDIKKVGHGIAAAFVATIYGVGAANLILLPAANRIKMNARNRRHRQELMLEGVCAITEGMNPKLIRLKLEAYAEPDRAKPGSTSGRTHAAVPAAH